MAIEKKNISISFFQGLDTKTDPNQVIPGKLVTAENMVFGELLSFNKTPGYQRLASASSGVGLTTFKDELVAFNGENLSSYSSVNSQLTDKGNLVSIDLDVHSVYRSATAQIFQDSAYNVLGLYLYTWIDSNFGPQYMVVNADTENQVIPVTNLPATAVLPHAWSIGNNLIVTYVDTANNNLYYIPISAVSLSVGAAVSLSSAVNATFQTYDGIVSNDVLYLAFNASDVGGAIRLTTLDGSLVQGATNVKNGENCGVSVCVFVDPTLNQIWVVYIDTTRLRYYVLTTLFVSILPPTQIANLGISPEGAISGYAENGSGKVFWGVINQYPHIAPGVTSSSRQSYFIRTTTLTNTGTVGTVSVFLRGVNLNSKMFLVGGVRYLIVSYGGQNPASFPQAGSNSGGVTQITYFVVNTAGEIIARIAYGNAGGYLFNIGNLYLNIMTNVNRISDTEYQFAYLFRDAVLVQQGNVYTNTGVNSVILEFSSLNSYSNITLGNNLNINGGYLYAYDGYGPTEQNFHLYPEDLAYTSSSASTGLFAGTYSYIALYEWTDNQGNIHKSGYGPSLTVPLDTATTAITVWIPTLRLTSKQNFLSPVSVTLYRDAPTIATGIYYKVSSITRPTLNSSTADMVSITDTQQDAIIVGNELLYTTGNVVTNTGGMPARAMTNYRNRLILVPSENPNGWYYSKTVQPNTPVEMAQEFLQFTNERFGELTAVSVMDDKLIEFKANAIFYQTGYGPDLTGANNDFSGSVFITSVVGTSNPKSIVLTDEGLIFQSNKGFWLLSRGLSVSYIGADVEDYNNINVTSAILVPNTTQVRFTLETGIALVYDYYVKQWCVFTKINSVSSTIFEDAYAYITPRGAILQQDPQTYTIDGSSYFMNLTTGWLSFAGFQGFQRVISLFLKAKFINPHRLIVGIAYDYNPAIVQSATIKPKQLINDNYGNDPFYGSTQFYGGNSPQAEQYEISLDRQKCQAIQITIQEALETEDPVYDAAVQLEAISVLVGVKSSYPRLPPSQRIS